MVKTSGVGSIRSNSSVGPVIAAAVNLLSSFTIRSPDLDLNSIAVDAPQVFFTALYNFLTVASYINVCIIKLCF